MQLPKSTEFNKRIPKTAFYENLNVSPSLKRAFVEQIKSVFWRNKIAPSTTNLAPGTIVTEIEVFRIQLNGSNLDASVLRRMDSEIPYHILFLLEWENLFQAWIGYKESTESGKSAFKVSGYYHTDWMPYEELPLRLDGLDMDAAYESFVRQIAGKRLVSRTGENLKDAVQQAEHRTKVEKEIARLEKLAWAEKQPKKKFELVQTINKLRDTLSGKE